MRVSQSLAHLCRGEGIADLAVGERAGHQHRQFAGKHLRVTYSGEPGKVADRAFERPHEILRHDVNRISGAGNSAAGRTKRHPLCPSVPQYLSKDIEEGFQLGARAGPAR